MSGRSARRKLINQILLFVFLNELGVDVVPNLVQIHAHFLQVIVSLFELVSVIVHVGAHFLEHLSNLLQVILRLVDEELAEVVVEGFLVLRNVLNVDVLLLRLGQLDARLFLDLGQKGLQVRVLFVQLILASLFLHEGLRYFVEAPRLVNYFLLSSKALLDVAFELVLHVVYEVQHLLVFALLFLFIYDGQGLLLSPGVDFVNFHYKNDFPTKSIASILLEGSSLHCADSLNSHPFLIPSR